MNKVINYFIENDSLNLFKKEITVYGWNHSYKHLLISSISNYLFEDLIIKENIVCVNPDNRPGTIKEKKYITVHDTGDTPGSHNAYFWSMAVFNRSFELVDKSAPYLCSYQYVVDNDNIYHNVPDNEVAYHAGDGTKFDYVLLDSGVKGTNKYPKITISIDGYYEIDGKKTNILAPLYETDEVTKICDSSCINDLGILCKLIDDTYYLGQTYFNKTYCKIANRGGNNNSIGIESCVNEGSDIYYTWQKTAKLVAYLMDKENLGIDSVVEHHYFSGKNCPETIRMSNMWDHLLKLIKFEYDILLFKKEGYKIELICDNDNVLSNGRINFDLKKVTYKIRTIFNGEIEEYIFTKEF